MNLPEKLLSQLWLEIEVNTRINEEQAQWNFLQRWNGDEIRPPIISNKSHSLTVQRYQPQFPTRVGMQAMLDYYYQYSQEAQKPAQLQLLGSPNPLVHFDTQNLLILTAQLDNQQPFHLLTLKYTENALSVPSFQIENDDTGFIPGLSFTSSKVNQLGQRFEVGLRVFIEKRLFSQLLNAASTISQLNLPVIQQVHQKKYYELDKLRVPCRFHPYLERKLVGTQQRLVKDNVFSIGGECYLNRLVGARRGVDYKFEYFVYNNKNCVDSGVSQVQRSAGRFWSRFARPLHFGLRIADFSEYPYQQDEGIFTPFVVRLKLYELYGSTQVQYVGFCELNAPLLPGHFVQTMYLNCPKRDRFDAQKVEYGYSSIGTCNIDERFGLECSNAQIRVDVEFNMYHYVKYIQSEQGRKMGELATLQSKLGSGVSDKLKDIFGKAGDKE